jgi:hypothetical protein
MYVISFLDNFATLVLCTGSLSIRGRVLASGALMEYLALSLERSDHDRIIRSGGLIWTIRCF